MKRYGPYVRDCGHGQLCGDMEEDPDGRYILASDAQVEIDRLRGLVEAAYREGTGILCVASQEDEDACWLHSDARKSLTPPAGKEQT